MFKVSAALILALSVGYGLHALAQPRIDARLALVPIGSSSSNGIAFAWFYDPAERTVQVCRTGQAAGEALDCKAKATLP